MKKYKLVIFMPSIEGGGVEKNLFIITNYLASKVKKAIVITVNDEFKNKFNKNIEIITPKKNIWKKFGRKIKYFICLINLIKIILNNKNISVFSFQANMYAIVICKLFGIKIITRSNSSPSGWSKNFIKLFIFQKILKSADKIIVNSQEFKYEMKRKFKVNAYCIYNPLDKKRIIKLSKEKVKYNFFDKNKNILKIINIGRYVDQKDQLTLLKALNLIKSKVNFKAVIMGRGIKKREMEIFIRKNNLYKNVKLLKFQNNPYKYLVKSNLFILTSIFEGLPNVLLEALTLKKIIISSNCPTGPKEILEYGKGGILFEMSDYKKLASNILHVSKNFKRLRKKVNFGFKSLKRFDSEKNLNKYLYIVRKTLKV